MLHAAFQLLVDFVEKERPDQIVDRDSDPQHKHVWKEMYIWTEQKKKKKLIDDVLSALSQSEPNSIKQKDGPLFAIQPVSQEESLLNVKGIDLGLFAAEGR